MRKKVQRKERNMIKDIKIVKEEEMTGKKKGRERPGSGDTKEIKYCIPSV